MKAEDGPSALGEQISVCTIVLCARKKVTTKHTVCDLLPMEKRKTCHGVGHAWEYDPFCLVVLIDTTMIANCHNVTAK